MFRWKKERNGRHLKIFPVELRMPSQLSFMFFHPCAVSFVIAEDYANFLRLDSKHVVFGKVIRGHGHCLCSRRGSWDIQLGTREKVIIADPGEIPKGKWDEEKWSVCQVPWGSPLFPASSNLATSRGKQWPRWWMILLLPCLWCIQRLTRYQPVYDDTASLVVSSHSQEPHGSSPQNSLSFFSFFLATLMRLIRCGGIRAKWNPR